MFAAKDLQLTRPSGGYVIPRSLRFRSSASAYLNRTMGAAATDGKKFTLSFWMKIGKLQAGTERHIFCDGAGSEDFDVFLGSANDFLSISVQTGVYISSNRVYRDPAAWYHHVISVDTTQATAANRVILYVNGVVEPLGRLASYPALNFVSGWNKNATANYISNIDILGRPFDGELAEIYNIDGQALAPTSFGAISNATGVWAPITYTGTYGTNGFHLDFNSYATTAALGTDTSGNGNTWTVNNISVTAGVTYDSMIDSPTNTVSATQPVGNYAVLNPINAPPLGGNTIVDGNLNATTVVGSYYNASLSTIALPSTGKFYCEIKYASGGTNGGALGVISNTYGGALSPIFGYTWNASAQYICHNGTNTASSDTAVMSASGQTGVIAVDMAAGKIWLGSDRTGSVTWVNGGNPSAGTNPTLSISGGGGLYADWTIGTDSWFLGLTGAYSGGQIMQANFGQRPFAYSVPTGFTTLCTSNLQTPSILIGAAHMAATTYTGTGASQTIANTVNSSNFQPDFVWMKGRSGATDHALYDSVRGTTNDMASNTTAAETTQATGLTAFGSTGFTIGALAKINTNAATYVGWQWKGSGTTVSNTTGSITSTVCVNPTAGFSVLTYTGTGVAATIGHSLGVAPSLIIVKPRSATGDWISYTATTGAGNFLLLDTTAASAASTTKWNNTSPTSSVFSVGIDLTTNTLTTTYVAYCFAPIAGYSAFGSYTGNSSADGPFVFCGFRPRWLMVKNYTSTGNDWVMVDTTRNPYNVASGARLYADTAAAEGAGFGEAFDINANGFKLRVGGSAGVNDTGVSYIYAAFAESPFKNSLAR